MCREDGSKTLLHLQVSGAVRHMKRSDSGEGIIKIEHNTDEDKTSQDTWLVVRKQLTNASQVHVYTHADTYTNYVITPCIYCVIYSSRRRWRLLKLL